MSGAMMRPHKIKVVNKNPGHISTGANTVVLLDDKPLKGVMEIKIDIKARGLAKITLVMLADVDVEDIGVAVGSVKSEELDKSV